MAALPRDVTRARVRFLGTGTSHGVPMIGCSCAVCRSTDPRDNRLRTSIYIDVEGGPALLVDTGPDLRQQALRYGITRVDAILFTHAHADHVMGMDEVRRFNVLASTPLQAYGSAATLAQIRRTFSYAFDPGTAIGGGLPQIALTAIDEPFTVAGLQVVPVPLLHGSQPIFGFRIGDFAYLTDCNAIPGPSWPLLAGTRTLVLDALRHRPHPTHFSLSEAVQVAHRVAADSTWLVHMCHDLPHAATNASLPPGIELAYDGLEIDLHLH